jgi:hypothetical protein
MAKETDEQRPLTSWRTQSEEQVIMAKETERATGTHLLERADRGASQDSKRNKASDVHSPTGERRDRDKSGHRIKSDRTIESVSNNNLEDEQDRPTEYYVAVILFQHEAIHKPKLKLTQSTGNAYVQSLITASMLSECPSWNLS